MLFGGAFSKNLDKPTRAHWEKDEDVTNCRGCDVKFQKRTLTIKHHCRACGKVFCADCSDKEIEVIPDCKKDDKEYVIKKKRVCRACYDKIWKLREEANESKKKAATAADEAHELQEKLNGDGNLNDAEVEEITSKLHQSMKAAEKLHEEHDKVNGALREAEGPDEDSDAAPAKAAAALAESGMGAYLCFSPENMGCMKLMWSQDPVDGALVYAKPRAKVPAFKFARGGKWELKRNIQSNKDMYFAAWTAFFQQCSAYDCLFVDLEAEGAPLPAGVWLHHAADGQVEKVEPKKRFTLEGIDVVAVNHRDSSDLDVPSMARELFVQKSTAYTTIKS